MKTWHNNDMTKCLGGVYTENDIELLWLIKPGTGYDENEIGKWRDWWYRCCLQWKQNSNSVLDQIGYDIW